MSEEDTMDFPMYHHVERQARRMTDMMDRLDVDPVRLARLRTGDAFAEARLNCIRCSQAVECLAWLDKPGDRDAARAICPNHDLFMSCRRGPA